MPPTQLLETQVLVVDNLVDVAGMVAFNSEVFNLFVGLFIARVGFFAALNNFLRHRSLVIKVG